MDFCTNIKVGYHPWIFSGNGIASVNFMSSSKNDISTKGKDYGAWVAFNKQTFVSSDGDGIVNFD
jgi:hypothetical protein